MPTGPALRAGDTVVCPLMDGSNPRGGGTITSAATVQTVLIRGISAAVANAIPGGIQCVFPMPNGIAMGSMTVLIGGFSAARVDDQSLHAVPIGPGAWLPDNGHR
jgi:uncharacterized Zn-binding protein involved in type VI secretion